MHEACIDYGKLHLVHDMVSRMVSGMVDDMVCRKSN
jgi:hypothetical protein